MADYEEAYAQSLIEQGQKCRGNALHKGPLYWCMWQYVAYYTGVYKMNKRVGDKPHYSQAEGFLCEKCIQEFCALRVPNKRF